MSKPAPAIHTGLARRFQHGLSFLEAGPADAEPVLLLHGVGESASAWDAQIDRLSLQYRVIAVDAPGYGNSAPALAARLETYLAPLATFIEAHIGEPLHLIGHSWGTLLCTALAARPRVRLRSISLVSATLGLKALSAPQAWAGLSARLSPLDTLGLEGWVRVSAERLMAAGHTNAVVRRAQGLIDGLHFKGVRQATQMMLDADLIRTLRQSTAPCLLLYGGQDPLTPPAALLPSLMAARPDARARVVDRCGHLAPIEQAEKVSEILLEFINQHQAP